jgi:hypothetical protein
MESPATRTESPRYTHRTDRDCDTNDLLAKYR